jgi:acyl-homoserine lactone acylase PvdQ
MRPTPARPFATARARARLHAVTVASLLLGLSACSTPTAPPAAASGEPAPAGTTAPSFRPVRDEILWDRYGVPHVYGTDRAAVFFGYGYAQAQSHGDEVLRLYGEARGRGAEYWGESFEATTTWVLRNDIPTRAREWYAAQDPTFRGYLDAFAAGINAYARAHADALDPAVRVVLPVSGVDVVAHAHRLSNYVYVAPPTFGGGEGDAAPPGVGDYGYRGEDGSNTWAIAGSKTKGGKPILLQNPHLSWQLNYYTYYEAHLTGPDFEIYGATQIGLPIIRFAFNRQMGISNTVNAVLGATWYRITPRVGGYAYDGAVRPYDVRVTRYRLRGADGKLVEKPLEIRSTVHGPVFERRDGTLVALRVAGLDRPGMLHQYFDMTTARSHDDFLAAMRRLQVPTFNISYADRDGNIEYIYNGVVPKRKSGDHAFWSGLVPGDDPQYLWTDVHAFDELPRATNPPSGFVQNTNDPPWFPSWPTPLKAADYPPYFAARTSESMRSQNSLKLMAESGKVDLADVERLKLSTRSLLADRTLPDLLAAARTETDPDVRAAVALLAAWDHDYTADNRAGLLFEEWAKLFAGPAFTGVANYAVPFDPARATSTPTGIKDPATAVTWLKTAIAETKKKYGALDRVFGDVSRFTLGSVDVPGDGHVGGLGPFRVLTWGALDAAGKRYPQHGETWIAMVDFATPLKARGLMTYGNSRQRGSTHRSDQLALLSRHEFRDLWLSRADIETHTEETTDLVPAGSIAGNEGPIPFTAVQPALSSGLNSFANAWGDYDGDGDLDVAVSLAVGEIRLYRNDGGRLTSVGAQLGLPRGGPELRALSWGDYDGDGYIDLLAGPTSKDARSLVFHNEAGKGFREVAEAIGLTLPGRSARQTNWIDYDGDGDLDVHATDRAGANHLLRNDGGRFTRVLEGAGVSDVRASVGACWFDVDLDGDLDLFLANQAGAADALWRNDGDTFVDVAAGLGVAGPARTAENGGVGCAVGDFDNDGDFDLFVPNYGRNQLYRRNADGTFTDVAPQLGLDVDNHAVGADWGDVDNDGDLDLSVMSYDGPPGAQQPRNALFRNDGAKGFVNVLVPGSALDAGDHGTQLVDYDGDGALDLSITDGYGPTGGHFLFRSGLADAARRRSLAVRVVDADGHETRFGAEVRLIGKGGTVIASRLVAAGGGYNTQRATPVHFGLASTVPVNVEVTFPSKSGRRVVRLEGISPARYAGGSLEVRAPREAPGGTPGAR